MEGRFVPPEEIIPVDDSPRRLDGKFERGSSRSCRRGRQGRVGCAKGRSRGAEKEAREEGEAKEGEEKQVSKEKEERRKRGWREEKEEGEEGSHKVKKIPEPCPRADRAGPRSRSEEVFCQRGKKDDPGKEEGKEEKGEEKQIGIRRELLEWEQEGRDQLIRQRRHSSSGSRRSLRIDKLSQADLPAVPGSPQQRLDEGSTRFSTDESGAGLGSGRGPYPAFGFAVLPTADPRKDVRADGSRISDHSNDGRPCRSRQDCRADGPGGAAAEKSDGVSQWNPLYGGAEVGGHPDRSDSSRFNDRDERGSQGRQRRGKGFQQSCQKTPMVQQPQRVKQRRQRERRQRQEGQRQGWKGKRWRQESGGRCKEGLGRPLEDGRKGPKEGPPPEEGGKEEPSTERLSSERKTPEVGATPEEVEGVKNKEGSLKDRQKASEKKDTMTLATLETMNEKSSGTGGAGSEEVQENLRQRVLNLRERVKSICSCNLVQDKSLSEVGKFLHSCVIECCKPWSMADFTAKLDKLPGELAYNLQEDSTLETWGKAVLLGLQLLEGLEYPRLAEFRCDPAQKESILEQLRRFDVWDVVFGGVGFEKFFETRNIDYSGEEVRTAQNLNWEAVSNSLPEGVGRLKLTSFCTLGTKDYVENFEQYLIPEESRVKIKNPRVMIEDGQWKSLAKGLMEKHICEAWPIDDVYHLQGEPVLNGMFAVGKGEYVGSLETQRLIMNLVPINQLCKELSGDISTLPSLANFGLMMMGEDQVVLTSSEDVRCFFYLFETPHSWRKYMCFNRMLDDDILPEHLRGRPCVLSARVLPMGFANSVSIAQHVHRNVVNWAAQEANPPVGFEGEIRKDKGFPSSLSKYRIYLDNFDQLEVMDSKLADEIKGTVSPMVLALRERYAKMDLPRHPKKAVSRECRAEVQGALVLGDKGIAIPKPQKLVQYMSLAWELLSKGECKLRELQVVCGGFVYFTGFRRPLLCCLNAVWRFMEEFKPLPPVIRLPLPDVVVMELVRFMCLVPLAQLSFTSSIQGTVTCSDASETGGGMCASLGLTSYGVSACLSTIRGDVPELTDMVQVLSIGLFDGLGALRVACDLLNLPMAGHVSVEQDAKAMRVVEAYFPDTVFHDNVLTVDEEMVTQWALKFSNVGIVILGAGPPCQGVSNLNADKRGALKDHRSKLFQEVPRIRKLVVKAFRWAQVHLLMESVASMDDVDREVMSEAVELKPWHIDSSGIALCRRPRYYWVSWDLLSGEGAHVEAPDESWEYGFVGLTAEIPSELFLEKGWKMCGDRFPTFTTARPSPVPGRKPAGLHTLSAQEKEAWIADEHRFPPYQYAWQCGLVDKHGNWRAPSVLERELCMGFPRDYTKMCVVKSEQKGRLFENIRMTLLGNSWQVGVIAWLLRQLFHIRGLCDVISPQVLVDRMCPGSSSRLQSLLLRPSVASSSKLEREDPQGILVQKLMGIVSIKGEDLLLQASSEPAVKFHRLRASIPAALWKWRAITGWQWKGEREHINCLEMRAVYTTLKWWVKKRRARSCRILHLVDSLVCLHALSRGRTSSRKLRRTLMRINSLILSADLHPIWGYVHTSQNPADRPSRRVKFVKRKWGK